MDFHLFMYATIGRRHELVAGMAGQRPELCQRMLDESFLLIPRGIHERGQILRSLELFATNVMPRFAGGGR